MSWSSCDGVFNVFRWLNNLWIIPEFVAHRGRNMSSSCNTVDHQEWRLHLETKQLKWRILAQQNDPKLKEKKKRELDILCQIIRLVQLQVCWVFADLNVCLFWFSRMQSLYLFVSSLSNIYELISQICRGALGVKSTNINSRGKVLWKHIAGLSVEDQWTRMQTLYLGLWVQCKI